MQPRLRATLVVGAIAVASAIAGAAIDRSLLVRPPRHGGPRPGTSSAEHDARRRAEMVARLERDLTLTPVQRVAIDSIIARTDSGMRAIRSEMQPRIQKVLDQSRDDIASRLDAAQREKFLRLSAERGRGRR